MGVTTVERKAASLAELTDEMKAASMGVLMVVWKAAWSVELTDEMKAASMVVTMADLKVEKAYWMVA